MTENRKHVYNILVKNPGDKVSKAWYIQEEEKKKKDEDNEWKPLTGEARAKKLAEFKAMIDSAGMINAVPRMSLKQAAEEGDWRLPKKPEGYEYNPSVVEQLAYAKESKELIRSCRRKFFLDAFPDASEEEIHAYFQKFEDSKD